MKNESQSVWSGGAAYEPFDGRWIRLVAREFLGWLQPPVGGARLDIGCGTGGLIETISVTCAPSRVHRIDPSNGYLGVARAQANDGRALFERAGTPTLEAGPSTYDTIVSGLVLDFIPDEPVAVAHL